MRVIFTKDVSNIARKDDVKDVANGYALNFLIPNNLAVSATAGRLKAHEVVAQRRAEEKKIKEELLLKNLSALNDISVEIKAKTNEQGHLFKGIHKEEIVRALKEQARVDMDPDFIVLKGPIKEAGEHTIPVAIEDKKASFVLKIQG